MWEPDEESIASTRRPCSEIYCRDAGSGRKIAGPSWNQGFHKYNTDSLASLDVKTALDVRRKQSS